MRVFRAALAALALVLFGLPALGETDYPSLDSFRKLTKRVDELEGGLSLRVKATPGAVSWTTIPGWRTLEVTPAGGVSLAATSPSNGAARLLIQATASSGGSGSGFPLTNDVSFATNGATSVEFLQFTGSTNRLQYDIALAALSYGGLRIAGGATNIGWGLVGSGTTNALAVDQAVLSLFPSNFGFGLVGSGTTNPLSVNQTLTTMATVGATNGIFSNLTVSGVSSLGPVSASTINMGSSTSGNFTVLGDLTVTGTTYEVNHTIVNTSTTIYAGVVTQYVTESIWQTNTTYLVTYVYTNLISTNQIDTYVNAGGSFTMGAGSTFDATNAAAVMFPFFVSTATGGVVASGAWDVSGVSFSGLWGQATTNLLTNINWASFATRWGDATTNDLTNVPWASLGNWGLATTNNMTNIAWSLLGGAGMTNSLAPVEVNTNVSGTWAIDFRQGACQYHVQAGAITAQAFAVDSTNSPATAEIILSADTNAITWSTNIIVWSSGASPTQQLSARNVFVFRANRGRVHGVYVGAEP